MATLFLGTKLCMPTCCQWQPCKPTASAVTSYNWASIQ